MGDGPRILGIDVGGVIIEPQDDSADTSFFGPNFLATPPVPGVFEAVARLVAEGGFDAVHVVSKAKQRVEGKTRQWFAHHDFATRTGVPEAHWHFCPLRHLKAEVCARIGVTHFVDDRLDVLGHLAGVVPHRFWFAPAHRRRGTIEDTTITLVADWAAVEAAIGAA